MSPKIIRGLYGSDHDFDHEDFDRPRRTRPRTKNRPKYEDAETGYVFAVDRGRYRLLINDIEVTAMKARRLGRKGVIVGDKCRVVGDISGRDGTLARIVEVLPRKSMLRRSADDTDSVERPIVANADQLLIVTALADPPPRPGMIDRILVAAYDAGIQPILTLTKRDLADDAALRQIYQPLDLPIITTQPGSDLTQLRKMLRDHHTVFVGHSGVGKSTLINALVPEANRETGKVNEITGRGRHTSTSAEALQLPGGGWVIDTPGVRSFGLSHVKVNAVIAAFSDLAEIAAACPRFCQHTAVEPDCALDQAVAANKLEAARLDSFRRILVAVSDQPLG